MGKIIRILCNIIFVILIIALACYFILRNMGIVEIYEVETGSMEHGIHVGDYVLISKKNKYVVGDIVTYKKDNYFITHRIIKSIDGDKVITKGDANNAADEEISMSAIVGKVIFIGGILNIIVDYKFGIVGIFLAIYLLTCYYGVNDNSKNNDEEKENVEEKLNEKTEEESPKNKDTNNQEDKKETVETVTLKDGTELELIPEDKQTKNEEKDKKQSNNKKDDNNTLDKKEEEFTSENKEKNNLKKENKEDNNRKKENDKKESDINNKDNKDTLDKKEEESVSEKEKNKLI